MTAGCSAPAQPQSWYPGPAGVARSVITDRAGAAGRCLSWRIRMESLSYIRTKTPALFLVYQAPLGVHCRKLLTAGLP